jgi:hypothetical protein
LVGAEGFEPPGAYATGFQNQTATKLRTYAPINACAAPTAEPDTHPLKVAHRQPEGIEPSAKLAVCTRFELAVSSVTGKRALRAAPTDCRKCVDPASRVSTLARYLPITRQNRGSRLYPHPKWSGKTLSGGLRTPHFFVASAMRRCLSCSRREYSPTRS